MRCGDKYNMYMNMVYELGLEPGEREGPVDTDSACD